MYWEKTNKEGKIISLQSQYYKEQDVIIEKINSKQIKDLTGKKFNKWNVVGFAGLNKDLKSLWWCYCDCDTEKYYILVGSEISNGKTKSCGCLIKEENIKRSYLWKEAYEYNVDKDTIKRLHRIFNGMKDRCYNKLSKDYPNYGDKGIIICDEWLADIQKFIQWSMINYYDKNLSIDRINVYGNYEPKNCRWISLSEQNGNKSTTTYIDYKNEKRTLKSVLNELGIKNNYPVYRNRIVQYGWSLEKTISTPIRTHMKKDAITKLLNHFEYNKNKISKRKFCEIYEINYYTFCQYLCHENVVIILKENNIIDDKKGNLMYGESK